MTPPLFARGGLTALAASALVTLSPLTSRAEQFVLFDVTFEYTWEDAINATPSKSHYYVKEANGLNLDRPDNWLSPVDYRNGKVHIHVEVLEKPEGGQEQGWALCYVGNAGSYGCPYTDYYTAKGTYDKEVSMTSFYNDDTIDWSQGIKQVDLVYTINDSGQGHVHFFPDLKDKTTPTKVRIALVQVAAGSTYDPAGLPGGGMGGSGGMAGGGGAMAGGGAGGAASGGAGGAGGGAVSGGSAGSGGQPATGGAAGTGNLLPAAGSTALPGASGSPGSAGASGGSAGPSATTSDAGSCAVSSGRHSSWGGLALLGLLGLRRRARQRRAA